MDRRLTNEDVQWLRKLCDAQANSASPAIPINAVRRLAMLGCAQANSQGGYAITLRGRDELVDRELEQVVK